MRTTPALESILSLCFVVVVLFLSRTANGRLFQYATVIQILLPGIVFGLITGCSSSQREFDSATIRLLSDAHFESMSVQIANKDFIEIEENSARAFLRSLRTIKPIANVDQITKGENIKVLFQSGKNPLEFELWHSNETWYVRVESKYFVVSDNKDLENWYRQSLLQR